MQAIQYFYRDRPVEIHGTDGERALIHIGVQLVAVPLKLVRVQDGKEKKESDEGNETDIQKEIA